MAAVVAFLVACASALVLTPLVRTYAVAHGWVHVPRGDRWSTKVTALLGGCAIFGAILLGCTTALRQFETRHVALVAAGSMMFVTGLIDDRLNIKPHTKLIAQILAAVVLVENGFRFGFGLDYPRLDVFDQAVTVVFLVGVTNAFNLLDNMDGLSAGVAAIAATSMALLQLSDGHLASAALSAAVAGACLGFLRYNFSPASIFMGDCGSLTIGLLVAGATLLEHEPATKQNTLSTLLLPVVVLMIPLMDMCLVTIARKWARRPISQGGCDHTSHRLVAIGLSERRAVLFLYALSLAGGAVALAVRWLDWYLGHLLLPLFLLAVGGVGMYLGQVRVYEEGGSLGDLLDRTPIPLLAQHRYRRRLVEVAIDSAAIAAGWYLSHLLRFEEALLTPAVWGSFVATIPLVVGCHLAAYFVAGVYRGIWRHTSVSDLPRFLRAEALALLLTVACLAGRGLLPGLSRSLLAINLLVQLGLLAGTRVGIKLLRDRLQQQAHHDSRPVLLVGAPEAVDLAVRRMRLNPEWGLAPAGIVVEDRTAVGLQIHGTPVVATSETLRDALCARTYALALLVDEEYALDAWERVERICAELNVPTRALRVEIRPDDATALFA